MAQQSHVDALSRIKRMLRPTPNLILEGADDTQPVVLTNRDVDRRVQQADTELGRIVRDHLDDRPELHEIAGQITSEGATALRSLADDDSAALQRPEILGALEVIVRTDGSRPSFMIRDGHIDYTTSPAGTWKDPLQASQDVLERAIACVGRIDQPNTPQGFAGTGFLIAEDMILTNRHVLQQIATRDSQGEWTIKPGVVIDFGHEFRTGAVGESRTLKTVLFAGKDEIDVRAPIDHAKLDLALIDVGSAANGAAVRFLPIDIAPDWSQPDLQVCTIGYPANPGLGETFTLLEQLFRSTFGYKRIAPGLVTMPIATNVASWTFAHDCTTLGGNSGSLVIIASRGTVAAGLHYGGIRKLPRENWGHVLGQVLNPVNGSDSSKLLELLKARGATLVDTFSGGSV